MTLRSLSIALAVLSAVTACGRHQQRSSDSRSSADDPALEMILRGTGTNFSAPLYERWAGEYRKQQPNVLLRYIADADGSIDGIASGTADFVSLETPWTLDHREHPRLQSVPLTLGAVAIVYNVPRVPTGLKLTREALAAVFGGTVTRWNDATIAIPNPGVSLPDSPITVIARSDPSGATAVVAGYLDKAVPRRAKGAKHDGLSWPVGGRADSGRAATQRLKVTPGAIGYLELAHARAARMGVAAIENRGGSFALPELDAVAAAARVKLPETLHASIVDPDAPGAYPLASYGYVVISKAAEDAVQGKALLEFLWWAVHDGQAFSATTGYAPLPALTVARVEERLKTTKAGGDYVLMGPQ